MAGEWQKRGGRVAKERRKRGRGDKIAVFYRRGQRKSEKVKI